MTTGQTLGKKWKPYLSYKDSGAEWLLTIPSHWEIKRLKFNSYMKGRIGWQNLRSDEFTEEGPYLITGMHFANGSVDWNACYHISKQRYDMAPEIQIRMNDLLITKDGSIGKLAYIEQLPGEASLNSHLLVLRPLAHGYLPRFLYHLFSSSVFQTYSLIYQTGTTFSGITQETVGNFPMFLPSILEQESIAAFLDRETEKIDALVGKKERLIELLQEKRAALIIRAVTKGLDPTVQMSDSGIEWLGEIPAHWQVKRVKYLFKLVADPAPENNDFDLLSLYTDIGVRPRKELEARGNKATTTDSYWLVRRGDLVVNKLLAWMGAFGVSDYNGVTSPAYDILRPVSHIKSSYYHNLFRCGICLPEIRRRSYGIMDMRLRLYFDRFGDMPVPVPPEKEQALIVSTISEDTAHLDRVQVTMERTIALLKEYRTALISAAVTGKIDVRERLN